MFALELHLEKIEQTSAKLRQIPSAYFGPQGTGIPDIGWYVLAAIKKTASLSHAFCTLVRCKNTLAASALIRLQLDTALRISGLSLVDNLEDAGAKLMNDENYSLLKSRSGERLTDKLLHENLDKFYPGISHAYKTTSAYVHLSASHIKTGLTNQPGSHVLFFHLNGTDDAQKEEDFADIIDWFEQATTLTAEMIEDFMRYRYAPAFARQIEHQHRLRV